MSHLKQTAARVLTVFACACAASACDEDAGRDPGRGTTKSIGTNCPVAGGGTSGTAHGGGTSTSGNTQTGENTANANEAVDDGDCTTAGSGTSSGGGLGTTTSSSSGVLVPGK